MSSLPCRRVFKGTVLAALFCAWLSAPAIQTSRPAAFDEQSAGQLLGMIRDGLQGHSSRTMLRAFDLQSMTGGQVFKDQINSLFNRYDSFRVHFNIQDVAMQGERGIVTADFELEALPADNLNPPVYRHTRLKFMAAAGAKGWKLIDLQPRSFFS